MRRWRKKSGRKKGNKHAKEADGIAVGSGRRGGRLLEGVGCRARRDGPQHGAWGWDGEQRDPTSLEPLSRGLRRGGLRGGSLETPAPEIR